MIDSLPNFQRRLFGVLSLLVFLTSGSGSLFAGPVVTSVDYDAVPVGASITLTGTGLAGATGARFLWGPFGGDAVVNPVNDTTLEVVMPNLPQPSRDYLMLVEGPNGSTVLIPPVFREVTSDGVNDVPPFSVPTVVRAGGRLEQSAPSSILIVETGGVVGNIAQGIIIAEDGAVIDFTGVTSGFNSRLFYSPDTVIVGEIPAGMTAQELTSIESSHGLSQFTLGFEITVTVVGDGEVTVSPDLLYHGSGDVVTLTAVPGEGQAFSGWSGAVDSAVNPLTPAPFGELTATFLAGRQLEFYEVPGVRVEATPDLLLHPPGSVVSLEAVVEPGYEFLGWSGDAAGTGLTTTVTMEQDLVVFPVVRALPVEPGPQISGVDYNAVPVGGTITASGSALDNAARAWMLWQISVVEASVNSVSEDTVEIVMPELFQGIREHILLLEGEHGSTVVLPPNPREVTAAGLEDQSGISQPILVRAGGNLDRTFLGSVVVVEAGGIVSRVGRGTIIATNGAVIDFRGMTSQLRNHIFLSPETIVLGEIPSSMIVFQLPPIEVTEDFGTFTYGSELNVTILGQGQVAVDPDQQYFRSGTQVTLTATPGDGQLFSGWSGSVTSSENPVVGSYTGEITATFSAGWSLDFYEIPGVSVQVTPDSAVYAPGTEVVLEAVLEPGYEFLGWAGDASGSGLTTTLEMTDNRLVLPIARKRPLVSGPQIVSSDNLALPPGATMTLDGENLAGVTAASLLWGNNTIEAPVTVVDETRLEIEMPQLLQGFREHLMLLEGENGSTLALPAVFSEVTALGTINAGEPGVPTVVRAGGVLEGAGPFLSATIVQTGGVLRGPSRGIIIAENGAVIDFRGVASVFNLVFYRSPETVVLGEIPAGMTVRELTAIEASFDVGSFTVGYPLNLTVDGPGSVSVSPEKEFYGANETVTLVATPDEGTFFIRWLGLAPARESTVTARVGGNEVVARFSTAPDFFNTWRPEHFTDEELGDLRISSFDADPDKDSLSNAAEYALGTDPRNFDSGNALKLVPQTLEGVLKVFVEYRRPKNALDVEYVMLLSTDSENWVSNLDDPEVVLSVERSAVEVDEDTELVTVELFPGQEVPTSLFVRISATLF